MRTAIGDGRAVGLLSAMIVAGIALLTIPWFLTPPAYLELSLRDAAFGADLSRQNVAVADHDGKTRMAAIRRVGNAFVARIGRIDSGAGTYTARVAGYKPATAHVAAAPLENVRLAVDLAPTFGRLEISTMNAMRKAEPVVATVKDGGRQITPEPQRVVTIDLPPGKHHITAQASGFCEAVRELEVRAGETTKAALPLSPDLTDDEIARFVLGWHNEPRDLDTHFWKADASRFPSATTVYFHHKEGVLPNGKTFARLDVDELYPGAYETLTVRKAAIGEYRYFIHAYQGTGTIGDADATVQIYTRGCRIRTFTPPPDCTFRIWNVVNLRYDGDRMELDERQVCEPEGTTIVRKSVMR